MDQKFVAITEVSINVPKAEVWEALTNPEIIREYMFGTQVISDWKEGSPIIWKGVWEEGAYEDKGIILKIEPETILQFTHFSPLTGAADVPENYHTLTYELSGDGDETQILLSQDNNISQEEKEHSEKMWEMMLESLKKLLEK